MTPPRLQQSLLLLRQRKGPQRSVHLGQLSTWDCSQRRSKDSTSADLPIRHMVSALDRRPPNPASKTCPCCWHSIGSHSNPARFLSRVLCRYNVTHRDFPAPLRATLTQFWTCKPRTPDAVREKSPRPPDAVFCPHPPRPGREFRARRDRRLKEKMALDFPGFRARKHSNRRAWDYQCFLRIAAGAGLAVAGQRGTPCADNGLELAAVSQGIRVAVAAGDEGKHRDHIRRNRAIDAPQVR